ncbi:hypothetical protein NL676_035846 [Syzygium grande]|nr:hypothetical protein NL676_035846 [Syzygium grande]
MTNPDRDTVTLYRPRMAGKEEEERERYCSHSCGENDELDSHTRKEKERERYCSPSCGENDELDSDALGQLGFREAVKPTGKFIMGPGELGRGPIGNGRRK